MLTNLQLRYTLDPWQVLTPEQNFTFFIPSDEAWTKVRNRIATFAHLTTLFQVPPALKYKMLDGNHWQALQYVYKRHLVQGQALMYTDLRERTYIMMNEEKVIIRRRGRCKMTRRESQSFNALDFELYWPRGNRVARIREGGEIAGINGFMHVIDNVLIYEPDLRATGCSLVISDFLLIFSLTLTVFGGARRQRLPRLLSLLYLIILSCLTQVMVNAELEHSH